MIICKFMLSLIRQKVVACSSFFGLIPCFILCKMAGQLHRNSTVNMKIALLNCFILLKIVM